MHKIDKSEVLAQKYKTEIDQLNIENQAHPKYSSNHRYYRSVLLSLLSCQNGLCAYTEFRLMEKEDLELYTAQLRDGEFSNKTNFEVPAQIEHFDTSLKEKRGWEWSNLFAVFDSINTRVKNRQKVDEILKPDLDSYNPFEMLSYDIENQIFVPNERLSFTDFKRVTKMIKTLGLNWKFIRDKRKEYLLPLLEKNKNGDAITPHQFITAFEMSKKIT